MTSKFEKYKGLGDKALKNGKYKEALDYFERANHFEPKNSIGWSRKAAAYIYLRQYSDAMSACDEAIELDKKNADAWFNRGLVYDRKSNYDKALSNYETALKYDPRNIKALNNKGTVLGQLERWDEAKRCFEKVLEFDPKNEDAKENLKLLSDYKAGKHKRRCFIATAAYGTPFANEIKVLRYWRDNSLLISKHGKILVELYYKISPGIAKFISRSQRRMTITRFGLEPFVLYFSKKYKK